jgi:tetratricopeptide (TPR) repeat protein
LEPDNTDTLAQAYVNRGFRYDELGRFDEAIADFTAAIELEPDNTDILALAYAVRGFGYDELGRVDEAIADWTVVIGLLPADHELAQFAREFLDQYSTE